MSNLYRGPSIDASYQVSYHLAKGNEKNKQTKNMINIIHKHV